MYVCVYEHACINAYVFLRILVFILYIYAYIFRPTHISIFHIGLYIYKKSNMENG